MIYEELRRSRREVFIRRGDNTCIIIYVIQKPNLIVMFYSFKICPRGRLL